MSVDTQPQETETEETYEEYEPAPDTVGVMSVDQILSLPEEQRHLIANSTCSECFLIHAKGCCGY